MSTVTVICSGKGGVGKSTVTVGLGYALAKMGKRVLIIDCDAGLRCLDRLTAVEENLVYDISDIIRGNCSPRKAIYPVEKQANLFVLPAPSTLERMVSPKAMEKLIPIFKKYYDHILLDCPAGLGRGFNAAVVAADKVIVVCTPDPVCVRNASLVGQVLAKMEKNEQRLIINKFNNELFNKIEILQDLDKVIDETGIRLLGVVPEDNLFVASLLKGEKASELAPATTAMKRISARIEGVNGPILL